MLQHDLRQESCQAISDLVSGYTHTTDFILTLPNQGLNINPCSVAFPPFPTMCPLGCWLAVESDSLSSLRGLYLENVFQF